MRRLLFIFSALFLATAPLVAFSVSAQADHLVGLSVYPNPFDSRIKSATIEVTLDADAQTSIDLYNVFGIKVRSWSYPAGSLGGRRGVNRQQWRGRNSLGSSVSKGVYFAIVRAGGARRVRVIGVIH